MRPRPRRDRWPGLRSPTAFPASSISPWSTRTRKPTRGFRSGRSRATATERSTTPAPWRASAGDTTCPWNRCASCKSNAASRTTLTRRSARSWATRSSRKRRRAPSRHRCAAGRAIPLLTKPRAVGSPRASRSSRRVSGRAPAGSAGPGSVAGRCRQAAAMRDSAVFSLGAPAREGAFFAARENPMVAFLLAVIAAAPAPACNPVPAPAVRFTPGEQLRYKLDVLGADVGTFEVTLEIPQGADRERATLMARSRAKTSAFVSTNLGRYEAFVSTLLHADLMPVRFREDLDEGENHRSLEVDFPPRGGKLQAKTTINGKPDSLDLAASPAARDILSTFFLLRAQPLKRGTPICAEVYAARKMWTLAGTVGPREQIETPLGKFNAVRIDATATRHDDPGVKRST